MDVQRMDIEMNCCLCEVQYRYYELTEEERQELQQISPEYRARDDKRIGDNLRRLKPPPPPYSIQVARLSTPQIASGSLQSPPPHYAP
ncbi:hypothetical protein VKT23_019749 [Stygiomarasmius scandens]|uniref:Uncharacterized protein n=1 Tax=Marasmiellus scandens TaxID=2682957 RepID=A0ABR1IKN1_9AGAR